MKMKEQTTPSPEAPKKAMHEMDHSKMNMTKTAAENMDHSKGHL